MQKRSEASLLRGLEAAAPRAAAWRGRLHGHGPARRWESMAGPSTRPVPEQHPALKALENAPLDDEPVTEEEERAVEEARAELRSGVPTIPHDEVKRRWL